MELESFNRFLGASVNTGASDIHFKVGASPALRVNGELLAVKVPALSAEDTQRVAGHILSRSRYKGSLEELTEHDASYALPGVARFRASIFRSEGNLGIILRAIPYDVPSFASLNLPAVLEKVAQTERGLVLVTGVTGSGKSSTLAAIVGYINAHERKHVLTIEDPIEFFHEDKLSRVTQREIGPDTPSFAAALKASLRQDPDVIMLGEMRDIETIEIALKAAETGHLVLSTVHTQDAVRTINRLLGAYPPEAHHGVRARLADALKSTVSQRLLPPAQGSGRVVACEVMLTTRSIQEFIRDEERTGEIKDYLEKNRGLLGTQSFDQHLAELLSQGKVTLDVAKEAATNPSDLERAVNFTT
ncbi:MAG: PilT/PilU family type 4a pilus ATPase [Deltaproteobacteria bacterium]|nr:PilT/PilU family type 4a pilus ATPase [Deltaproteobacteria bacterium]